MVIYVYQHNLFTRILSLVCQSIAWICFWFLAASKALLLATVLRLTEQFWVVHVCAAWF